MIRAWARRAASLHGELAAIAELDPRWWLLAGAAAAIETAPPRAGYITRDAELGGDTFMGQAAPPPRDPIAEAIARARAAREALRELDGELPGQPLAVTLRKRGETVLDPSALEVAAFAAGGRVLALRLDDPALPARLAALIEGDGGGTSPHREGPVPFVCVSIGEDPIEVARHGHRRAWADGRGPWIGIGRAGGLATVSTCHLVVDGYGHARITSRIAALAALAPIAALAPLGPAGAPLGPAGAPRLPPLAPVPGAIPLGVAWRALPVPAPRALPLAYALGALLHRRAGVPGARFSPTFQVPLTPGERADPNRRRRRVLSASLSVRFEGGAPEPYAAFAARARGILAREAQGQGLVSRLLAATRAAPAPVAWKRRGIGAERPRWLDRVADVLGGRASLSRIYAEAPLQPTCAVAPPPRLASAADPLGACVITVIDDGARAAITACGSGLAGTSADAAELLDELLASPLLGAAASGTRTAG